MPQVKVKAMDQTIPIYKKSEYDLCVQKMKDGAFSKAQPRPKITDFFNGGSQSRVYWNPEHGCRQQNKPRKLEDQICKRVFTSREELTKALKIPRARDDLDKCAEYLEYRKNTVLAQIVLGI